MTTKLHLYLPNGGSLNYNKAAALSTKGLQSWIAKRLQHYNKRLQLYSPKCCSSNYINIATFDYQKGATYITRNAIPFIGKLQPLHCQKQTLWLPIVSNFIMTEGLQPCNHRYLRVSNTKSIKPLNYQKVATIELPPVAAFNHQKIAPVQLPKSCHSGCNYSYLEMLNWRFPDSAQLIFQN